MRLWLLCGFAAAVALVAVAGADRGDSKKGTGVGVRRQPHRPCSGCFSVLSEESQAMPWRASEDEDIQSGRQDRPTRKDEEPAQPARRGGSVRLARQVPNTPRREAAPAAKRNPTAGKRRGPNRPQATL
ncbi:hypothetical protein AV530_010047 [Patagioenas fasciata monilis]|uniref:Secreted protein n=1 Tax=Patagioenas fasciata monilis TaxID=372326 RepID=A0A1V4KRM2_PATFA|nr:hypothetical protein AV530_010047 [Patagioenas fasciata monilis]